MFTKSCRFSHNHGAVVFERKLLLEIHSFSASMLMDGFFAEGKC